MARTARQLIIGFGLLALSACAADVGERTEPIVNGRAASAGELYGTVAIVFGEIGLPDDLASCTGTLIRETVVLTAAHCMFAPDIDGGPTNDREPLSNMTVVAGSLSLFTANSDQSYRVVNSFVHPDYDNLSDLGDIGPRINDIALVVTDRPVTGVSIAALVPPDAREQLDTSADVTVSGYGSTEVAGDFSYGGGELMIAQQIVDVTSATEFLAFGNLGMDTCQGDSGGPAYFFVSGTPYVAGVTSRADPLAVELCGGGGIYTTAHAYEAWIVEQVGPPSDPSSGGGCSVAAARPSSSASWLLLASLVALVRSRRVR